MPARYINFSLLDQCVSYKENKVVLIWSQISSQCIHKIILAIWGALSRKRSQYLFREIGFFNEADTLESSSVLIHITGKMIYMLKARGDAGWIKVN